MVDFIAIPALFAIIAILFSLEATTSLARIAGLNAGSLAGGLQLQSGLSLFSRALMAIFMPMLGGLADFGHLNGGNIIIVCFSTLLIPLFLFITHKLKDFLLGFYQSSANNLIERGTYFPIKSVRYANHLGKNNRRNFRQLTALRVITFFAYIPYYLTWPLIIISLSIFPDWRGFIIGLSSVTNSITTIALLLYVDPKLIMISRYKNLSVFIYYDQLMIRIYAAIASSLPFVIGGCYLYWIR